MPFKVYYLPKSVCPLRFVYYFQSQVSVSTSNPAPQKFSLSIVLVDNLVVKLNEENLVENLTVSSPTYYYVDLSGSEKDTLLQVVPINVSPHMHSCRY